MSKKRDFFISYNKADKQWAKWIAATLESESYSTYIQAWDFRSGDNFVLDMQKTLVDSERFIAVLSADYMESLYCQAEWASAFTKDPNSEKRTVIPVRVTDVAPEGLLATVIYIDLFGKNKEEAEKLLLQGVDVTDIPRNRPSFPGAAKVRFPGSLPFHNLPYVRNPYFTGREKLLDDIHKVFQSGATVFLTQSLTSQGGWGKTQLVLEYAYRYGSEYEWIWWTRAENDSTVLADYKDFAVKMELLKPEQQDSNLIIETVLNWMDAHAEWLFIYDNAEDITGTTRWWPRNSREHILITTRNRHMQLGQCLDIALFSEEEAVAFFSKRTGLEDRPNAKVLAQRLGRFPLALEQAAAYIKMNSIEYVEYLSLLEDRRLTVLTRKKGLTHYDKSIHETLAISIDKVKSKAARQLLNMCAYLASENIAPELFSDNLALLPPSLQKVFSDNLESIEIWTELTQYALLAKQETNGYSMHRLLQEVLRNRLHEDSRWARYCLALLGSLYKFSYDRQDDFLRLSPHVEACVEAVRAYLTDDESQEEIASLYATGGGGTYYLGHYPKALAWYHKALAIFEKVLGIDHPDTANTRNNIAVVYHHQCDYPRALEWYYKALPIVEKILGKEHPSMATTYNNIAEVYRSLCDYPQALEWHGKALAIREKVLGIDHPDTAITYHNVAMVYHDKGEPLKALKWHEQALAIRKKMLDIEHPDTATTYHNVALVYDSQGDYPQALKWLYKALTIREKMLGIEHPDTATTHNHIAMVHYRQGEITKALEWCQQALVIREKVLGIDHLDTATTYNNIALVYYGQGETVQALEWAEKALVIFENCLGPEHPHTQLVRRNITAFRAKQ